MTDKLYTVKEVSKILKVNANAVYTLINAGLLPALKLGSLKVREKSLENFLAQYDGCDLSHPSKVVPLSKTPAERR